MSAQGAFSEPVIPPEPVEFQTRPLAVGARLFCGSTTFYMAAFTFAYVYLRSLDSNNSWKIGSVNPSGGLGVTITALLVLSAVLWRVGYRRSEDSLSTGIVAIVMALVAIVLQFVQYTTLGFGPASGGYASVFIGWTVTYILGAVCCLYWLETQVATLWRARKHGLSEEQEIVLRAGIEASSFYWAYYVAAGVLTFFILYVI